MLGSAPHIEKHGVRVLAGILASMVTNVRRITYMLDLTLTLYYNTVCVVDVSIYLVTEQ